MSEKKNTTEFIELPLEDLRQMFASDVQKKFLQEQVVEKQKGTAHPQDGSAWWMVDVVACAHENLLYVLECYLPRQDPTNDNMRIYKVFKSMTDASHMIAIY